jgi:hypothetical protein
MSSGLVLLIAGVWVLFQVSKGNLVKLIGL